MLSVPCGGEEGACTRLPTPGDNRSSSSEEREASELEDCTASWGQRAAHMNQSVCYESVSVGLAQARE